jgi:hypothetical protein
MKAPPQPTHLFVELGWSCLDDSPVVWAGLRLNDSVVVEDYQTWPMRERLKDADQA